MYALKKIVIKMSKTLPLAGLTIALLIGIFSTHAHPQLFSGPEGRFPVIMPPFDPVDSTMSADTKGMTDPTSPFIFPPIFRAQARGGPMLWQTWGTITDTTSGYEIDFTDDLDMLDRGFLFNFALRLQIGRASARGHWDIYYRNIEGGGSNELELPAFRFGVDYDLISRPNMRIGLNLDVHERRPRITFDDAVLGRNRIVGNRPFTGGFHAEVNPANLGNMAASLFASYRMSLRTSSKLDELEVAAGLRTPETMLGTLGLRTGWRYSRYNFGDNLDIKATMSGYFLEMVYFY
jgi:hypothetical protein